MGGMQFHPYLTPFAVMHWILWTVSKDILVAQFDANFRGDVGQVVRVIDGKSTAAGGLANFRE